MVLVYGPDTPPRTPPPRDAVMNRLLPLLLFVLIAMTDQSHAAQRPHTPAVGSEERKIVLEAAHKPAEHALGQPVAFVVETLNVCDGWAFLYARMQTPGGARVSYAGTPFAVSAEEGGQSDMFAALMRQHDGQWTVLESSIGPTDPVWLSWDEYGAPDAIFAIDD